MTLCPAKHAHKQTTKMKEIFEFNKTLETPVPEYILERLTCPITHLLFLEPVMADDGFVYEKSHLKLWFERSAKPNSPMTGLPLQSTKLRKCVPMKLMINDLLEKNPELEQFKGKPFIKAKDFISEKTANLPDDQFFEIVNQLKAQGDLNAAFAPYYFTLLSITVCISSVSKVKYLIEAGADPLKEDDKGNNAFDDAFNHAEQEVARYMIDQFKITEKEKINLALAKIAAHKRFEIMRYFIEKNGVDVNFILNNGVSVGGIVVERRPRCIETMKFLIERGFDFNSKCDTKDKESCFMYLCGHSSYSEIFLVYGYMENQGKEIFTVMLGNIDNCLFNAKDVIIRNPILTEREANSLIELYEAKMKK